MVYMSATLESSIDRLQTHPDIVELEQVFDKERLRHLIAQAALDAADELVIDEISAAIGQEDDQSVEVDDDDLEVSSLNIAEEPSGDVDDIGVYLRQIGKVPLLTKEGEQELGKRMEAGLWQRRVSEGTVEKTLSREQTGNWLSWTVYRPRAI